MWTRPPVPMRPLRELDAVPWSSLTHAYDHPEGVREILAELASPDVHHRRAWADQLVEALAHQGSVYSSTAAAMPFLWSVLHEETDERTAACILDVLATALTGWAHVRTAQPAWVAGMHADLLAARTWVESIHGTKPSTTLAQLKFKAASVRALDGDHVDVFAALLPLADGFEGHQAVEFFIQRADQGRALKDLSSARVEHFGRLVTDALHALTTPLLRWQLLCFRTVVLETVSGPDRDELIQMSQDLPIYQAAYVAYLERWVRLEYDLPPHEPVLPVLDADRSTQAHVLWVKLHLSEEEVPRRTREALVFAAPRVPE